MVLIAMCTAVEASEEERGGGARADGGAGAEEVGRERERASLGTRRAMRHNVCEWPDGDACVGAPVSSGSVSIVRLLNFRQCTTTNFLLYTRLP